MLTLVRCTDFQPMSGLVSVGAFLQISNSSFKGGHTTMSGILSNLRKYAAGSINESTLRDNLAPDEGYDFEADDQFMQECMGACLPTILQMELMDESAVEAMDEDVKDAFVRVQNYLVENGLMDETSTVPITNPKITMVRMSKEAQKHRLTAIIALKMARKENSKAYKKYKLGQKIKKENFLQIMNKNGAKAERLAKKLLQKAKKGKVGAVVEQKKAGKK